MANLDPIPSPPEHHWREFREKLFPAIGFLTVLVTVAVLWSQYVTAPGIVGQVESASVDIISTVPGLLSEVNVDSFSRVSKDQVLARVYPLEPQQLEASFAAIQSELQIMKARMDLDRTRNSQSLAGLRYDLELERLSLAAAEIQFIRAKSEFERTEKLLKDKVIALGGGIGGNDFGFEVAVRDRDTFAAEVESRKRTIQTLEAAIELLQASGTMEASEADPLIEQAIAAQRKALLLTEGPIELRSPIDGMAGVVTQRAGVKIMAGVPILTIMPLKSERIVGYVRQPLHIVPKPGDRVQIRSRGSSRQTAYGQVMSVGSGLQQVTASMLLRTYGNLEERGLPFMVSLPPEMNVFPGELVDLIIQPGATPPPQ